MTADPTKLSPAERLRAAAAKLRTLLTELGDCRGPWYVVNREQRPYPYPQRIDNIGVPYVIASTTTDPSTPPYLADYIALMHPCVGYAITQLLESVAARLDDSTSNMAQLLDPHALIAARLILEAGATDVTEPAPRAEHTLRDRMAAAIYETNVCSPWAEAHPDDVLAYGWDADAALRVRDDEMTELRQQAARSDAVTAETKALMERRTTTLRERAERAEAVILQALTGLTTTDGFARGFRLVQRDGLALDGAVFPSGRCFVLDDSAYGLATVAVSVEELLRGGYHGARIEWADQQRAADQSGEADQ